MPVDIKTTTDGDLDLTNGLTVASDRERDRQITINRVLTVRGEIPRLPSLGVTEDLMGRKLDEGLIVDAENEVLSALGIDAALRDVAPTVKVVPLGFYSLAFFIQLNKSYNDGLDVTVIAGDFWNRDENMTLLDGSEG